MQCVQNAYLAGRLQYIEYKTNKYNRVINPLGRLEIYRYIIYKKQLQRFTCFSEQVFKLLIW